MLIWSIHSRVLRPCNIQKSWIKHSPKRIQFHLNESQMLSYSSFQTIKSVNENRLLKHLLVRVKYVIQDTFNDLMSAIFEEYAIPVCGKRRQMYVQIVEKVLVPRTRTSFNSLTNLQIADYLGFACVNLSRILDPEVWNIFMMGEQYNWWIL